MLYVRFVVVIGPRVVVCVLSIIILTCVGAVARGKRYNFEAYMSDELVEQIHKLLRIHPTGIVLDNFLNIFQVIDVNKIL